MIIINCTKNKLLNIKFKINKTQSKSLNIDVKNKNINYKKIYIDSNLKKFDFTEKNKKSKPSHLIPYNKQWTNGLYTYNNKYNADVIIKQNIINKLLKSYFGITSFYKSNSIIDKKRKTRVFLAKNKVIRKSLNKIMVTKPELKYTNDNVIINIYTLDREKEAILNKTFSVYLNTKKYLDVNKYKLLYKISFLKKKAYLSRLKLYNLYLTKNINDLRTLKKIVKVNGNYTHLDNKNLKPSIKNLFKWIPKDFKVKNIIYKNKLQNVFLIKGLLFKNIFFYFYFKWILSLFKIKTNIKYNKKEISILLILYNIKTLKTKTFKFKCENLHKNFKHINIVLLYIIYSMVTNLDSGIIKRTFLENSFKEFKNKYYMVLFRKYFKKQVLSLHYLFLNNLNNFKYNKFLPIFKNLAFKIFNKNVKLNIVKLKYIFNSTDISAESLALKLKKRKIKALDMVKSLVRTVKLPEKYYTINNEPYTIKNYRNLNLNLVSKTKEIYLENKLDKVLFDIFNLSNKNKANISKSENILNSIKNKWVKGIRIEIRGRLTRRYTAERAVFKYKYKGNLRNTTFENSYYRMNRGDLKPNLSYTQYKSTKNIGAFGIKGWISTI